MCNVSGKTNPLSVKADYGPVCSKVGPSAVFMAHRPLGLYLTPLHALSIHLRALGVLIFQMENTLPRFRSDCFRVPDQMGVFLENK